MSSKGDTIASLWLRKDKPNCPLSGECSNTATDLLIPAGAGFAVIKNENRTSEKSPTHRLVVFPPREQREMQPQTDGNNHNQQAEDDVPF